MIHYRTIAGVSCSDTSRCMIPPIWLRFRISLSKMKCSTLNAAQNDKIVHILFGTVAIIIAKLVCCAAAHGILSCILNKLGKMKAIGSTPLIKLERMSEPGCADIYLKYEAANRTGSMKDRMAWAMIEGAEKSGKLKPGGSVVEYTGGSTGSSLAMVCAKKGYQAHFVSSDAFAEEKLQTMRAFGAEVEIIPSENRKITAKLIERMIARARELSNQPNTFWPDQFNNVDNRNAYHDMARETIEVLGKEISEFIMGVGTGGCFSGNAEVLKNEIPGIRCIAIEPFNVRALSGGDISGKHRLEGIGSGFVPSITRLDLADEIIAVKDEDAYETARKLARTEGLFGGITSGANVWAAIQRARAIGAGKKIVTVLVDSGLKYLNGDLYKNPI
jgi:cysteine synthase